MRQAGRYLPEYQALRAKHDFKALSKSPELAAQVTLLPMARFPLDAAIVFADIMSPLPALGVKFDFQPGPVIAEPLRTQAAVDALPNVASAALAPEVMATLRTVRSELPKETTLLGFCGAPWTLAAYLVEGKGVNGFPTLRAFAHQAPAASGRAARQARRCDGAVSDRPSGRQVRTRCRSSTPGPAPSPSPTGSASSARTCCGCCKPSATRKCRASSSCRTPRTCSTPTPNCQPRRWRWTGAWTSRPCSCSDLGVRCRAIWTRRCCSPARKQRDGKPLNCLRRTAPRGHIVNLGHGILPQTPLDSVAAFVEAVQDEGGR